MTKSKAKPFVLALGLSCISLNTWAQLSSPLLNVNSINNDNIYAVVSFPTPVAGDLYVAYSVQGQLYFLGQQGAVISTTPIAYQLNGNFSSPITVLNMSSNGIPSGTYPLYQVVTYPGSNPLIYTNWIGGLSEIDFNINLNNTIIVYPTPVPTPEPTPVPAPDPTPTPYLLLRLHPHQRRRH